MAVADVETARRATRPSPRDEPTSDAPAGHLPYFPALDGVRGIAVLAVLLFHAGFSWMEGGYLGVSTFFTLSGFLITSLLLAERSARGRVGLKTFWIRRFRRLMPAALACLVLILLFGLFVADTVQRENLAGDVVAALAYVANWRFIFAGQSYADLFAAGESPVLHFWSLAIEEQFYVLYPLLIAALVGFAGLSQRSRNDRRKYWFQQVGRHYRRMVGAALLALVGGSLAITLLAGFSNNRIYLGTDTRAAELLVGGLLAVVLFNARVTRRLAAPGRAQRSASVAGLAALAASVYLWTATPQTDEWLYRGGLTVYAVISAVLITAAILPTGPVAWGLALAPIRHLGRISYGVYLYHWPIFLTLRQKADLDQWPLFLVGGAITLVVAELSFHFLEMPIRRGRPLLRVRPIRVAPAAIAAIAVCAIVLTVTAPPPKIDFAGAQERLNQLAAEAEAMPTTTIDPNALVPPVPRIGVFGDSTALTTGWGLAAYLRESGEGAVVGNASANGCAIIRTDQRRKLDGVVENSPEWCNNWANNYRETIETSQPNIAMVQVGQWEIVDRKVPGDDTWRGPGDPVFDEFMLREMVEAVDVLSAQGAIVVWLTSPQPGEAARITGGGGHQPRMQRYNELVNELPSLRPGKVVVVDLASWVEQLDPFEDARLRPDGVHFTTDDEAETAKEVARVYLADAIIRAWSEQWIANRRAELTAGPPIPLLVVGDGTARRIGEALAAWDGGGRRLDVTGAALDECGIGRGGVRVDGNQPERIPQECDGPEQRYVNALFQSSADTALLHTSVWDVTDRQLEGDPTWRAPGDPLYDAYLRDEIAHITDLLHQNGVERVVWLLTPHIDVGREPGQPPKEYVASTPSRIDRLNDIIREVAAIRPFVTVLDYAAHARSWPEGEFDPDHRPDGVTPNEQGAKDIAEWLGPRLLELATEPEQPVTDQVAAPAGP